MTETLREGFANLPEADSEWRRLNARMLLIHPIKEIGRFFPALVGVFFLGNSGGKGHWWALGAGVLVIMMALLRWVTTRFRITPDKIEVRTGLFRRKALAASADRVRTVDLTSDILHRALGLAKVEIGTASTGRDNRLILDSLPTKDAQQLRIDLLHRRTPASHADSLTSGETVAIPTTLPDATAKHLILRLDPKWIRYAPLTLSGVISGLIIVGFAWRILNEIGGQINRIAAIEQTTQALAKLSTWVAVAIVTIALLLIVTLLSVVGYVLAFWRFRLSRHDGGTLHVSRGLLTTRATSIEERRLRGVELVEPLLLRIAHAGRMSAISTGLRAKGRESNGEGGSTLVPPAPVSVASQVGGEVLRDRGALTAPLTRHGPIANRRRYSRAFLVSGVVIAIAVLAWKPGLPLIPDLSGVVPVVSLALIPIGALLARDRYRNLGHALHDGYLVRRAGSLSRRTSVLQRDGVIGWNLRQSFFQRRSGVITLTATTAAGAQHYDIRDLEPSIAVEFAESAVPGLLRQFLA
ncbi:putative membrane protein [Antricoccus suffuscus]|uniref:Putative membrane protein n=1 Tax=Antricoccus suffuscus TaxID=1629062 RepID=A0A2T1A6I5_9ACTN|nr:PH domain-containing protein [Antricoccus suffuscus]PRZ44225.1 putative membrane protein [Antricoccus suffuscus]